MPRKRGEESSWRRDLSVSSWRRDLRGGGIPLLERFPLLVRSQAVTSYSQQSRSPAKERDPLRWTVLLLVMRALVAAIPCQDRGLQIHFSVPRQFPFAAPMTMLHDRILEECKKKDRRLPRFVHVLLRSLSSFSLSLFSLSLSLSFSLLFQNTLVFISYIVCSIHRENNQID